MRKLSKLCFLLSSLSVMQLMDQFDKTSFQFDYFQGAWSSHDPESGAIRKIWIWHRSWLLWICSRWMHAINVMVRLHWTQKFSESNPSGFSFKYMLRAHFFPFKCRITHRRHLIVLRKDSPQRIQTQRMSASQKRWYFSVDCGLSTGGVTLLQPKMAPLGRTEITQVWISPELKCWNYPG